MTTLREAAQQALEALEHMCNNTFSGTGYKPVIVHDALENLESALEQPEPPPEAQTKAEKIAYCAGWWAAMEAKARSQQEPTVKESLQVDLEEEPRVTQRIADMPMSEYRRGVNDGFKLGLREGRIKAEDEMMVGPIEPTRRMIEAGAQRLVSWEDGSVWPDSWDALQLAAARNDAERVWRSMRAEAPKQGPRREWRGLTDQEIGMLYVIWDATPGASMAHFARAIEAKLKEKNA